MGPFTIFSGISNTSANDMHFFHTTVSIYRTMVGSGNEPPISA